MGSSIGVFGFLAILLSLVAPRLFRVAEKLTGFDLPAAAISVPLIATIAAWAAADAYKTFNSLEKIEPKTKAKIAGVFALIYAAILTTFDILTGQSERYSLVLDDPSFLLGLTLVWATCFAAIYLGVTLADTRRKTPKA